MPLLIYNTPEAIQYAQIILDFTMFALYVLYDDKMLQYIKYVLYKLEKTNIAFENYRPIDPKLCQPVFNYSKFHAISHFIQYIWNYGSTINYNTAHNKVAHKYCLKAFSNKTNKKEYNLQIRKHNLCHTNIIAIKNVIAVVKKSEENKVLLTMENVDKTTMTEVAKVSSTIDLESGHS